ncbi:MAG TPA: hypothetical protein VLD67_22180 [Vicinamibacterales bacterium]|nr:hypothetical protein [Vicinamibacterales bacterium]
MPREAKLFEAVKGSPVRALGRLDVNIPPNWIVRARRSRKNLEPGIAQAMTKLRKLRRSRPGARATIKAAERELKALLNGWEVAYRKESFYNGLRALLEISREGKSRR